VADLPFLVQFIDGPHQSIRAIDVASAFFQASEMPIHRHRLYRDKARVTRGHEDLGLWVRERHGAGWNVRPIKAEEALP